FSSMTNIVSSGIGFGGMMTVMAARTGQGIGSGAYGAMQAVQQQGTEYGIPVSGLDMARAGIGGGLTGGLGGLVQGASHAGAQALRQVGAKEIAYEMRGMGSHVAKRFQDVAEQHGISVIQPAVDHALTENSAGVLTKLATIPVPEEQRETHMQSGATLLNLAHDSIETGNYSPILEHKYFKSVPVSDKETFAKAVSATIVNHGLEPQKLANISYNLEKIGGLTSDNIKEFIQNDKAERSAFVSGTKSKNT
ncbi:MAG: hypothetical protein KGI02_10020, partial [Thaumarchaeota archaeon]|nr:hypothetical protein [Nitrososphaerota archaeon]